jgi:hypothetical protein
MELDSPVFLASQRALSAPVRSGDYFEIKPENMFETVRPD